MSAVGIPFPYSTPTKLSHRTCPQNWRTILAGVASVNCPMSLFLLNLTYLTLTFSGRLPILEVLLAGAQRFYIPTRPVSVSEQLLSCVLYEPRVLSPPSRLSHNNLPVRIPAPCSCVASCRRASHHPVRNMPWAVFWTGP